MACFSQKPGAWSRPMMGSVALHPNVQFNYYSGGLGSCTVEMH
jgi:hypothetical protein